MSAATAIKMFGIVTFKFHRKISYSYRGWKEIAILHSRRLYLNCVWYLGILWFIKDVSIKIHNSIHRDNYNVIGINKVHFLGIKRIRSPRKFRLVFKIMLRCLSRKYWMQLLINNYLWYLGIVWFIKVVPIKIHNSIHRDNYIVIGINKVHFLGIKRIRSPRKFRLVFKFMFRYLSRKYWMQLQWQLKVIISRKKYSHATTSMIYLLSTL